MFFYNCLNSLFCATKVMYFYSISKSFLLKINNTYKLVLNELAQQTNFGVIENLIQLFQ